MKKDSLSQRMPPHPMFKEQVQEEGPNEGDIINIKGVGPCEIKEARMVFEPEYEHTFFRIIVQGPDGRHFATQLPAEVLHFTGWAWTDSNIPFVVNICREDNLWHLVDLDSQREHDFEAVSESAAVAQLISNTPGIGDVVMVHPIFTFSLSPSGSRWLASVRRSITSGGIGQGPLSDCFTHPDAFVCAKGPFLDLSHRKVLDFSQDLDDLFEKHFPCGIQWPAIGDGEPYCTHCFTALSDCACGE